MQEDPLYAVSDCVTLTDTPSEARFEMDESKGSRKLAAEPMPSLAERKALTAGLNAGVRLAAEIRRSAGPRTAARALPAICRKLGIPIDLTVSSTLAQEELDLSGTDRGTH